MSEIISQLTTTEGRDWLAMQFVLGELNEAQTAEFDAAMLNDPTLCDAVVNASRMLSGISLACETMPTVSRVLVAGGRRMGILLTSSVCLGVMAAFVYSQFLSVSPVASVASLVTDVDAADALVSLLPDETPADESADDEEFVFSEDSLADLAAPEWLLTAVELEQDQTNSNPPVDGTVY